MIKLAAKLAVITALAAVGTHFGYQQLEKQLLSSSCLTQQPKSAQASAVAIPDEPVSSTDHDVQIIVRRNLFKTAADKAAAAKTPVEQPPTPQSMPTALKLVLVGTVTGTKQTARAIIINNAGKDRKQQLLQIGEEVPETNAVLKEITWNSVTLDVNGTPEVLEMPKPKSTPGSGRIAAMNPAPTPEPSNEPPPEAAEGSGHAPMRPNRRINLPDQPVAQLPEPDLPTEVLPEPELPVEVPAENLPKEELPAPELPEELPSLDIQEH
jgi:type II secretory pathway component PulC